MDSSASRKAGKQSSKPLIGVRPPSGSNRPASGINSKNSARDPKTSNYQGSLASAKYFDGPNDFNKMSALHLRKDSQNKDEASKRQHQVYGQEELFNQSATSFHSSASKQLDPEQQKKLQKQSSRPFVVGSSRGSSATRRGYGKEQTPKVTAAKVEKENLGKFGVPFEQDALLSASHLGGDARQRLEIMKMLDRREKDAEELELESCFSELKQKAGGGASKAVDDEIESLAGQSMTDLKEMQEMQGLYRQNGSQNQDLAKQNGNPNSSGPNFYKPQLPGGRPGSQLSNPKLMTRQTPTDTANRSKNLKKQPPKDQVHNYPDY